MVQCFVISLPWSELEDKFICSFEWCAQGGKEQVVLVQCQCCHFLIQFVSCLIKEHKTIDEIVGNGMMINE